MHSKKIFSRWTIGAFIIFLLSSSISGLFTFQFGNMRSALSVNSVPTVQATRPAASPQATQGKPRATATTPRPVISPTPSNSVHSFVIFDDTFDRPDQNLWGKSMYHVNWEGEANASNAFFVQNRSGHVKGQGIYYATVQPSLNNLEVIVTGSSTSFQNAMFGPIVRWVNDTTWYEATLDGTSLSIIKRSSGLVTTLASVAFPAKAQTTYTIRCRIMGSTIFAKAWLTASQEPTNWLVTANDNSFLSGFGGISFLVSDQSLMTINECVLLGLI